jgi:hypothetical protein
MAEALLRAFSDELCKIAGLRDAWEGFLDRFRGEDRKAKRRVEYHFSTKAGPDRWDKFVGNVKSPAFARQVMAHPLADEKLVMHTQSMHDLANAPTVGKILSSRLPGKSYEVKELPIGRLGCTCADWRFRGSVNPAYECKHIKAFREGKAKADDEV